MSPIKPVTFTTPDGVERLLRASIGTKKLIHDQFGCSAQDALNQHGDGCLPDIAFALMHDEEGNPPEGITARKLAFSMAAEDTYALMGAVFAAFSNGRTSPNDMEAALRTAIATENEVAQVLEKLEQMSIGSTSGDSADNLSDSPIESSGGDTSNVRSMPSPALITNESETEPSS